ncbi:MAG: ATP-binding cassette domain-containing protein [Spirochaetota bacterium]
MSAVLQDDFVVIESLEKTFHPHGVFRGRRESVAAVKDVTLSIPRNAIMGLVGESGSGKTTLARSLLYLDPPSKGRVSVAGVELGALSRKQLRAFRSKMQIVFQDPNSALNPRLTVSGSIREALTNHGVPRERQRRRVAELLELVGISPDRMNRHPHEFSGGQKQRICVARALAMEPAFLVLDEPVSNLDVSIQAQIINLLLRLHREFELTYLFISHDLNLIGYMSDLVAVMKDGELVEMGPAERILSRPEHPYTQRLFASATGFHDRTRPNAYFVKEE